MTMTLHPHDQQPYGQQYGNMSAPTNQPTPNFHNPWTSQAPPASHASLYAASPQVPHSGIPSNGHMDLSRHSHQQQQQQQQAPSRVPVPTAASMAPFGSTVASTSAGSPQFSMMDPTRISPGHANLLSLPQDLLPINSRMHHQSPAASYATGPNVPIYTTTASSPVHPIYAPSPTNYEPVQYSRHNNYLPSEADQSRRFSQSSVSSGTSGASYEGIEMALPRVAQAPLAAFRNASGTEEQRREFQKAVEASQGMLSMKFDTTNQETPRAGVYNTGPVRGRSIDSYGFPPAPGHSTSSSVSSAGFSPGYYGGGSVDGGSVSDYSTAGSDLESAGPRALPRPQGLMPSQPPAPQSHMMTQFSSKVSSSTQKKHKCKVCEKRFTRPSSLQTHMYSHTGEKRKLNPYVACAQPLL